MSESDQLPEDLDVTAYVGPYLFPDIKRRRIAGACHAAVGLAALAGGVATSNEGLIAAGVLLAAIAVLHLVTAWHLAVDQTDALATASRAAGFGVGHASAQLGWRGLRSRPSWHILVYSDDEPPSRRGLVEVDAVDGSVLGQYVEDNPEDWSQYGLAERA